MLDFNKNQRLVIDHDQIDFTRSIAIVCHQPYKTLPLQEFGSNILGPMMTFRGSVLVLAIAQSLIHLPGRGPAVGVVQIVLSQSQCRVTKSRSRHRISIPDTL